MLRDKVTFVYQSAVGLQENQTKVYLFFFKVMMQNLGKESISLSHLIHGRYNEYCSLEQYTTISAV